MLCHARQSQPNGGHNITFVTRHVVPVAIATDNGPEFCGQKLQIVIKRYNIKRICTSTHYPQVNRSSERQHRTLDDIISKLVNTNLTA